MLRNQHLLAQPVAALKSQRAALLKLGLTDTAVVTINMSGLVWYVGASVTNGDGRSHNPFNSIANAQAAISSSAWCTRPPTFSNTSLR